ncbi:efflux RND transporter periplasmic adaptor subunit [Pararhodonellum marinum]|uniref:efflux RND transporter periplasmic adaptor subunit n=1 Tax=Pararhodonellum marinum TaxID=2755358 RepID=UPI00188F0662|nr:efflux RND transporter periplasmic adaptor subunit [Pararhodonellum marinum]
MKTYSRFLALIMILLAASCAKKEEVDIKKAELESKKKEYSQLKSEIDALEKEITALDPQFGQEQRKSILITTVDSKVDDFRHFVEVTGSVVSKKNVNISAEVSGRVQQVAAIEGMRVRKGEILARVDAETLDRNREELEKQLELATIVFEKQERLWDQQIGTEIQFLEAKNRKEILEKNLASLKTQSDRTTIRAPFDGTVEQVMVRLGELVQPGLPMFQFIGERDLFIEGDVSERYVGILKKGDSVEVYFPSLDKRITTKVTAIGAVINPNNRTFKAEVALPAMADVKPNMIAVMRIKDYEREKSVIVPNYLILQDNKGDYLYVVEDNVAKRKYIKRGKTYQENTEVLEGLEGNETLVDKGFREVGENFKVNIAG